MKHLVFVFLLISLFLLGSFFATAQDPTFVRSFRVGNSADPLVQMLSVPNGHFWELVALDKSASVRVGGMYISKLLNTSVYICNNLEPTLSDIKFLASLPITFLPFTPLTFVCEPGRYLFIEEYKEAKL